MTTELVIMRSWILESRQNLWSLIIGKVVTVNEDYVEDLTPNMTENDFQWIQNLDHYYTCVCVCVWVGLGAKPSQKSGNICSKNVMYILGSTNFSKT